MSRHRLLSLLGAPPLTAYDKKINALGPLAYWPLTETSGTTAHDVSGNARHGSYSNVTLGVTGIGDGATAVAFNGTTSLVDCYSASLGSAFNNQELSLIGWFQVSGAGVWTDATNRFLAGFAANISTNYIRFLKPTTSNALQGTYTAGGSTKTVSKSTFSPTTWFHLGLTVTKAGDALELYVNGTKGTTVTALGTWAGALLSTACVIGGQTNAAGTWSGNVGRVALFGRALAGAEVASAASV